MTFNALEPVYSTRKRSTGIIRKQQAGRVRISSLLLVGSVSLGLLGTGCQKANTKPEQTAERTAPDSTTATDSTTAEKTKPIDPALVTKAGEPMTPERFKAVKSKLSAIGLAFHNLHEEQRYFLPTPEEHPEYYAEDGQLKVSWRVHLLPYLNQKPLYEEFKLDESWDSPHNAPLAKKMPDSFRSPDTPADSTVTRFRVFEGSNYSGKRPTTVFPLGTPLRIRDTLDGTSNTLFVVEVGPDKATEWTKPGGLKIDNILAELGATGTGVPTLLVDGSVTQINQDIDEARWIEIISPQDNSNIDWKLLEVK